MKSRAEKAAEQRAQFELAGQDKGRKKVATRNIVGRAALKAGPAPSQAENKAAYNQRAAERRAAAKMRRGA